MLRFIDSFDHYASADIAKKWTSVAGPGSATITSGGRHEKRLALSYSCTVSKALDAQPTWVVGFAYKNTLTTSEAIFLQLLDGGTVQVSLRTNADGTLSLLRGETVVLATSVEALSSNVWYFIEMKVTIGDSGSYQVRVNGTDWIPLAAGDTQNAQSLNASANQIRLRQSSNWSIFFDDLYVCDGTGTRNIDFRGDIRVQAVFPNADGANKDFSRSDGDDNFALVDEAAPSGDTDYVESLTPGHKDTYSFGDLAYAEGECAIDGIQLLACVRKTAAGDKTLCPVVRVDGADYDGLNFNPSDASYSYMRQVYEQTPEVSPSNWTPDILNASEFGFKVVV